MRCRERVRLDSGFAAWLAWKRRRCGGVFAPDPEPAGLGSATMQPAAQPTGVDDEHLRSSSPSQGRPRPSMPARYGEPASPPLHHRARWVAVGRRGASESAGPRGRPARFDHWAGNDELHEVSLVPQGRPGRARRTRGATTPRSGLPASTRGRGRSRPRPAIRDPAAAHLAAEAMAMMRRAPKLSPRLHGAVAATPGSRGPTRRGGVTANAAAPKYSWAISGPLSTVKAGHTRCLSSTVARLISRLRRPDRDLPSWPREFDSRHPLQIIAPSQPAFSLPRLFEHSDKND